MRSQRTGNKPYRSRRFKGTATGHPTLALVRDAQAHNRAYHPLLKSSARTPSLTTAFYEEGTPAPRNHSSAISSMAAGHKIFTINQEVSKTAFLAPQNPNCSTNMQDSESEGQLLRQGSPNITKMNVQCHLNGSLDVNRHVDSVQEFYRKPAEPVMCNDNLYMFEAWVNTSWGEL